MAGTKLRAEIREFAVSMEILAREGGFHNDPDKSYLYARAKEGLKIIADDILTDNDALARHCANMGNLMMMLAQGAIE